MIPRYLLFAALIVAFAAPVRAEQITVAAAISLKESLEAVRDEYQKRSGEEVKFTFASSGQLASQIQNGAPIDLFLSAARKQVDDLKTAGRADASTAVVFASNELVLIVPAGAPHPPDSFAALVDTGVQHLAIGEPKSVPAGQYAQELLDHLKLTEKVKARLIYGTNVRQVLQYVQSGEVDAGLVYQSDANLAAGQVKVMATAKPQWHEPIEYWGVVVRDSKHAAAAAKFLSYLQSDSAEAILKRNGFISPTTAPTAPGK
jgi:molybdate transport system substrate-binding protein